MYMNGENNGNSFLNFLLMLFALFIIFSWVTDKFESLSQSAQQAVGADYTQRVVSERPIPSFETETVDLSSTELQHIDAEMAADNSLLKAAYVPPQFSLLTVSAYPRGAEIKVMTVKPKYHASMRLKAGPHRIVVKHPGYTSRSVWVKLNAGEHLHREIRLQKR